MVDESYRLFFALLVFCRRFVVCRDIGRTSSAVRGVYRMGRKSFNEITMGYKNRRDLGYWNASCAPLQAK